MPDLDNLDKLYSYGLRLLEDIEAEQRQALEESRQQEQTLRRDLAGERDKRGRLLEDLSGLLDRNRK